MPKKKSQLPPNANEKEYLHYNAVLLEEIRSQMNAVIETVGLTKETLEAKIDGVEKRLTERIEIVEMVVRENSKDIQDIKIAVKENSKDIQGLTTAVKEIKQTLDGVAEKVERHDEEIVFLKSAVSQT